MSTATAIAPNYRCPKHPDERLSNILRGGAGFCRRCNLYTQALGVPMPEPSPEIAAKRAAESKPKARKRTTKKALRKPKTKTPRSTPAVESSQT